MRRDSVIPFQLKYLSNQNAPQDILIFFLVNRHLKENQFLSVLEI